MKRSNRLILLIGIVLAIVVFVLIASQLNGGSSGTAQPAAPPTELNTVFATVDIPLGTQVRSDMLSVKKVAVTSRLAGAFEDPTSIVGQIVRTTVQANAELTQAMFASTGVELDPAPLLTKGLRAMAVQVDQVSGVGTLINKGDRVDAVVGFGGPAGTCGREFSVFTIDKTTGDPKPIAGAGDNSVKALVQNMQVVGTLLPPPPAATTTQASPAPTAGPAGGAGTALNGQQEIVILAVTPQQAEVIKYAQLNGCISLVLRSPKDFVDAAGNPVDPKADVTSGIILKTLVDTYGVLPPQIVEGTLKK